MLFFKSQDNKQLAIILLSISIDFCLFTLFITFAHQIIGTIAPNHGFKWAMRLGLILFSISGFTRVIGAVVFSYIENSFYRQKIFYFSTLALSISNVLCGLLPSMDYLGLITPIILLLVRILQGMVIGALIPEGIVFCYINAKPHYRMLTTCLLHFSVGGGFILATIFSLFFDGTILISNWRGCMILCGFLGLIMSWILNRTFSYNSVNRERSYGSKFRSLFIFEKWNMLRLICFTTFLSSGIAVFTYVMPQFLLENYQYSQRQITVSSLLILITAILGVGFAIFADKWVGKRFYVFSGLIFKFWLIFVFHSFSKHNLETITILNATCTFILGFYIAKLPVLLVSSFPVELRYSGVAIVYNLSQGIMFAVSHHLVHWIVLTTHSLEAPSMYIIFFSYISLISLWFMPKKVFYRHLI